MLWRHPPVYRNSLPERGRNARSSSSITASGRGGLCRRRRVMRQGPLAGRYPAVAAMVMLALIPYLALSAALQPLAPIIGEQLHMSAQTLSLSSGLANAAYAVGTV